MIKVAFEVFMQKTDVRGATQYWKIDGKDTPSKGIGSVIQ